MGTSRRRRRHQIQRRARIADVLRAQQQEKQALDEQTPEAAPPVGNDASDGRTHLTNVAKVIAGAGPSKVQRHADKAKARVISMQPADERVVARIVNLPFVATTKDILALLGGYEPLKGMVLGCLLKSGEGGRASGQAYVILNSGAALDQLKLVEQSGLTLGCRALKVYHQVGATAAKVLTALTHATSNKFELNYVRFGTRVVPASKNAPEELVYRWKADDATFDISPLGLGITYVEDNNKLRFEFDTMGTQTHIAYVGTAVNRIVLRFAHRQPPICVRLDDSGVWVQTVDVTWQGALPWCSMCEIDLDTSETSAELLLDNLRSKLLAVGIKLEVRSTLQRTSVEEKLSHYGSTRRIYNSVWTLTGGANSAFVAEASDRVNYVTSWDHVFDNVFSSLPFSIRYLLHALRAKNRLWFARISDARDLESAISDALYSGGCSASSVREVLTDFYSVPPFSNPVQALVNHFERLKVRGADDLDSPTNKYSNDESDEDEEEDKSLVRVYAVMVSPLRVHPMLPALEGANRILRLYRHLHDRFIRVSFVDERFGSFNNCKSEDIVKLRVAHILENGLYVAGRKYVFLAYSNSQLREQSCWFYSQSDSSDCDYDGDYENERRLPTANEIRRQVGDLSTIVTAAKYGARLGQAFSETRSVVPVPEHLVSTISDVSLGEHCFSDGVGLIASSLADQAARALELDTTPSAFQIRFGGAKGVVSVWPDKIVQIRSGRSATLVLRPSMTKFEGNHRHRDLEVCSVAKFIPLYLNRPLITLLSTLGVSDATFLRLLQAELRSLRSVLQSTRDAQEMVSLHAFGSMAMKMLGAGFDLEDEFLRRLVTAVRNKCLIDIQQKARILVPKGVCLMGIMDETGLLPPGTIYFRSSRHEPLPHGTKVAVGRNPSLHPGDIRVMTVDNADFLAPFLGHLVDVVVFSQYGARPDCNMMSGGDLDGDLYFVIWDPELIPSKSVEPMKYSHSAISTSTAEYTMSSTDVKKFFVNYVQNDILGVVANAHLALADQSPLGALDPKCLELAEIHSVAVDFAKSGIPANMKGHLFPSKYPDFMEKASQVSYFSDRILGQMYRVARKVGAMNSSKHFQRGFDRSLVIDGHEQYLDEAYCVMGDYCWDLWAIACKYGIHDEGELISGFGRDFMGKSARRHRGRADVLEKMRQAVKQLQRKYTDDFWYDVRVDNQHDNDYDGSGTHAGTKISQPALCKASAWYKCAYTHRYDDGFRPYLSFAWIASAPLIELRRRVTAAKAELAAKNKSNGGNSQPTSGSGKPVQNEQMNATNSRPSSGTSNNNSDTFRGTSTTTKQSTKVQKKQTTTKSKCNNSNSSHSNYSLSTSTPTSDNHKARNTTKSLQKKQGKAPNSEQSPTSDNQNQVVKKLAKKSQMKKMATTTPNPSATSLNTKESDTSKALSVTTKQGKRWQKKPVTATDSKASASRSNGDTSQRKKGEQRHCATPRSEVTNTSHTERLNNGLQPPNR